MDDELSVAEYRALAEFRRHLRAFLHFSEGVARQAGIEPRQYQVLLAIKGLPEGRKPTIGELADQLKVRHHSMVELLNRLEKRGLVVRRRDETDRRQVIVSLSPRGEAQLRDLARSHRAELQVVGPALVRALRAMFERGEERPVGAGAHGLRPGTARARDGEASDPARR